jgi:hypothetical protein
MLWLPRKLWLKSQGLLNPLERGFFRASFGEDASKNRFLIHVRNGLVRRGPLSRRQAYSLSMCQAPGA